MYNRYISQPDGSFRKKSEREPIPPEPPKKAQPQPEPPKKAEPAAEPPSEPLKLPKEPELTEQIPPVSPAPPVQEKEHPTPARAPGNPGTFLRNLLPQNFDTGDLLVVLLLLLIAGDGADSGTAIMTLALYLFL